MDDRAANRRKLLVVSEIRQINAVAEAMRVLEKYSITAPEDLEIIFELTKVERWAFLLN